MVTHCGIKCSGGVRTVWRKYFWTVSTVGMFVCGYVIHIAYEVSGHTAWSLLVSSVGSSPWEMTKPFALVYILWTFIELSCLRPSLLHFVCARIFMLHGFAVMSVSMLFFAPKNDMVPYLCIFSALAIAEYLSHWLYGTKYRMELFWIPIFISFVGFFTMLLFASVFPPPFFPFQ